MVVDFQGHDKKETSQKSVNSQTENCMLIYPMMHPLGTIVVHFPTWKP